MVTTREKAQGKLKKNYGSETKKLLKPCSQESQWKTEIEYDGQTHQSSPQNKTKHAQNKEQGRKE